MPLTKLAGLIAVALAAVVMVPATANAEPPYDPVTHESDIELPEIPCSSYVWNTQPRVIVHTGSIFDPDERELVEVVEDVNAQFNLVGATSARITSTTQESTAYTHTSFDDAGAIHVGFTSGSNLSEPDAWAEAKSWITADSCAYHSVNIGVDPDRDWTFGTPWDSGVDYYEAGEFDDENLKFFRVSYLHELLHAFDLGHTRTELSFRNYGNRPWVNRDAEDMIRPLPADVRQLRERYPAAGTRAEVAVVNTWFGDGTPRNGAAIQGLLCEPSLGSAFSASRFDAKCGSGGPDSGSTTVCEDDLLRTRYAIANYSTDDVIVGAYLYLSRDEEWDEDDPEATTWPDALELGTAANTAGFSYKMPDLDPGATYHPIVRLVAVSAEEDPSFTVTTDWSPLPGTVRGC